MVMTMTKSNNNKKSNAKTNVDATINNDAIYNVARVAREYDASIDVKRLRAFARKNVALYTMRKQQFTKSSTLYKQTIAMIDAFKSSRKIHTA